MVERLTGAGEDFYYFEQSVIIFGKKCVNLPKSTESERILGFFKFGGYFSVVNWCIGKVIEHSKVGQDGDGSESQSASSFYRSGTG